MVQSRLWRALVTLILLIVFASGGLRAQTREARWLKPQELLASTPERRQRAARRFRIARGEYVVALVSIRCGDCDREARELNGKGRLDHIIAVAPAPAQAVAGWKRRLGLQYRVVAVPEDVFDDLGGVILPTLVLMRDGRAVGVSEHAEVVE